MSKTRKIVHVVPAYPPSLGGMEQRVFELVNKLRDLNIEIEVFTSNLNTNMGDTIENGVTIHRLRKISFLQTPISFTLAFKLLFSRADIFHIHLAQPFFPFVASVVAVLRRKPYVVHIRAIVDSDNFFGKFFIFIYKKIALRFIFKFAGKIIVLTDSYNDILISTYHVPKKKVVVIPNATDFPVIEAPKEISDQLSHIKLVAVGRVDHQKNYFFMFRCIALLKKQGVSFTLAIVGTGRQQAELSNYAKELDIAEHIIWKGRLEGAALEDEYTKADVFIHTALFEGFATVLIEAMAKGLPICATRVLGVSDVVKVGYNGLLSDFNEEAFVHNLLRIIQDRELYTQLSANNLQTVPMYKWSHIIDATLDVYNGLQAYES